MEKSKIKSDLFPLLIDEFDRHLLEIENACRILAESAKTFRKEVLRHCVNRRKILNGATSLEDEYKKDDEMCNERTIEGIQNRILSCIERRSMTYTNTLRNLNMKSEDVILAFKDLKRTGKIISVENDENGRAIYCLNNYTDDNSTNDDDIKKSIIKYLTDNRKGAGLYSISKYVCKKLNCSHKDMDRVTRILYKEGKIKSLGFTRNVPFYKYVPEKERCK